VVVLGNRSDFLAERHSKKDLRQPLLHRILSFRMTQGKKIVFLTYEEAPECHPSDVGLASELRKLGHSVDCVPW
jgi:hypothetical protein